MGGEHILIKKGENDRRKIKSGSENGSMASLMPMCAGLVGPKSENVEISLVLPLLFEGSRGHESARESLQPSEPDRLGGGRGRVNPPPRRLVWRFWRFGGFVGWFRHLHAQRPEASADSFERLRMGLC